MRLPSGAVMTRHEYYWFIQSELGVDGVHQILTLIVVYIMSGVYRYLVSQTDDLEDGRERGKRDFEEDQCAYGC